MDTSEQRLLNSLVFNFVSNGKLLRKFNINIMVMKINVLFDKMSTTFVHISKF